VQAREEISSALRKLRQMVTIISSVIHEKVNEGIFAKNFELKKVAIVEVDNAKCKRCKLQSAKVLRNHRYKKASES
jgi:hypothetical protein